MLSLSWLVAAVVLCACGSAAEGHCWDITDCMGLGSQEKIMECVWKCRSKQPDTDAESVLQSQQSSEEDEEEERLGLGVLLSALSPDDAPLVPGTSIRLLRSEDRRPYIMEHFRWGKPTGRKRRPIKVHAGDSLEEEEPEERSLEAAVPRQSRRELDGLQGYSQAQKKNTKSAEKYRMTHFRWSAPPATKRYGGFMNGWSEQSHKPLLTLFRNVIIKDGR
ncbi:proopiomelanocortin b [Brachyhypopomus gauderio]|uniref:proopiomelanocortin b n=1 Tax=Brachyhypopomus gauderio TaxID=698409 RepID=UPI0040425B89